MSEENTLNPNEVKKVAKNEEEIRKEQREEVLEVIEELEPEDIEPPFIHGYYRALQDLKQKLKGEDEARDEIQEAVERERQRIIEMLEEDGELYEIILERFKEAEDVDDTIWYDKFGTLFDVIIQDLKQKLKGEDEARES